ncbi:MAG: ATP-binding cassette domain-containing protein [Ignisphaera sp.]
MSIVLSVKDLDVVSGGRLVVRGANLDVYENDIVFLLGPNGAGKTTFLRAVVGYPGYNISSGKIIFESEDLTDKPIEYRVAKGIAIGHQIPPKLLGIKVFDMLSMLCKKNKCDVYEIAREMSIEHLLHREFGKGFSGGELKRVEIATLLAQKPKIALVDEPDTGVDVDSIEIIAKGLKKLVEESPFRSIIIVTHSAFITRFIEPSRVCIMINGTISTCGDENLLYKVMKYGFKGLA